MLKAAWSVAVILALRLNRHTCLADPSEYDETLANYVPGYLHVPLLDLSAEAFVLGLRTYGPAPEANSSTAVQYQVSQFATTASHATCRTSPYILLATHLDFERLSMLTDLIDGWSGCVSAAVLVKSEAEFFSVFSTFQTDSVGLPQFT